MNIAFPKTENLSHEQVEVSLLNFDRNNLVLGAPGTGKTIVAIHRLHKLYEDGKRDLLMLVYNRPLMHYVETVKKELNIDNEFEIYTINDWVYHKLYCGSVDKPADGGIIKKPVPNIDGEENKYKIKWDEVNKDFENKEKMYSHIVVDEGQDISKDFYSLIVKLAKNVTIFMDPNQALFKESITIPEILGIIKKDSYFTMTLNYRNSKKVSDYTRKYCTDKTIFAESYKSGEDIEFIEYTNEKEKVLNNIVNIVGKYDENKDIGIILPSLHSSNNNILSGDEIYDELKNKLDGKYKVSIYWNEETDVSDKTNIDFSEKSIKIFSYMTVRGLDFDVVILLDDMKDKENDEYKNRIYVALTRAKDKLYVIPLEDDGDREYVYGDVNYSKFPVITNMSTKDCYDKAIEKYKNKEFEEAIYYMHYAISILGFDDNDDLLLDAIRKFAFLCNRFNKNDFALGMISNFAEKHKIYDDQELIYLYQKCLLSSYNAKYSYDNPDRFFKTLNTLKDKTNKDNLLSIYLNGYVDRTIKSGKIPDENFVKSNILSMGYINSDIWKKHIESIKEIKEEKKKEVDEKKDDEKINSPLWAEIQEIKGHDLLDGSYILVIASSHIAEDHYVNKAREFGYVEKDFKFLLDYEQMTNKDIKVEKFTGKPKAIIFGAHPHSMKDKGKYASLMEKFNDEAGYPKVFESGVGKDLSVSSFARIMSQVTEHLRQMKYDEEKYLINAR